MILYRPIGEKEYLLIAANGFTAFPPRLPHQPIFYPVLNKEYAIQIARDWNVKDSNSNFKGFVTQFEVDDAYISQFDVQSVGGTIHKEYWIPAEELENFNRHILGTIKIIERFD